MASRVVEIKNVIDLLKQSYDFKMKSDEIEKESSSPIASKNS